jgi:acylphosphatase
MSDSASASLHAIVRGRVQGVFFRAFVRSHAKALGLTGYVRNLQSGAVEVQAEGERGKLEELLQILHKGPPAARVEKVEAGWSDYSGDFSSFSVRS